MNTSQPHSPNATPESQSELLKGYYAARQKPNASTFCFAPQSNLYFDRRGIAIACCHNRKHILGTYPAQTVEEIWNSQKAQELRAVLANDNLSKGCEVCQVDLQIGAFSAIKAHHFDTLPIHPDFPTMMEFELANTCNLECVMCMGELSSSIRKNRDKLPPLKSNYGPEFAEQLVPFLPHLRHTRFSGGEPFFIPLYFDIWDRLIEVNPECLIVVQTNGTFLTERIKTMMHKGKFEIGVSLDSLDAATFEAIRPNASFATVMKHIEWFSQYCRDRGTVFRIAACVMRNNWKEMPDLVRKANEWGAVLSLHKVWTPYRYGLHPMDPVELGEIHAHLSQFSLPGETPLERENRRQYLDLLMQIKGWRDQAIRKAEPQIETQGLSLEQLQAELYERVRALLANNESLTDVVRAAHLDEFITKNKNIMFRLEDPEQRIFLTKLALEQPVEVMLQRTLRETEDTLFRQIQDAFA